jgi:leucyl/phenylalanyl-tRNA--protein transferase
MAAVDPPRTRWLLPDPAKSEPGQDLVGVGADSRSGTMLAGYRAGLFSMEVAPDVLGWYSPDPRGVLPLEGLHVSRSLRRSMKRYRVSVDQAFEAVVTRCADPTRTGAWITKRFIASYQELHSLGWAHSVEVWEGNRLAGGLFGVEVGGLFAGESMFHTLTDASKVAVAATVSRLLQGGGPRLFDVQWWTPHLGSLGVVEMQRSDYLINLSEVLATPPAFSGESAPT